LTDSLIDQARAALNAGEGERGEALARRAAEEGQAGAHTLLARICRARGELDEAMVHAEAALDHDPADAVAWAYCGSVLLARGDTDDAVQSYERAVSLRPGNAILLNEHGNALAAAGRFADAEATLRQAIDAEPDRTMPRRSATAVSCISGAARPRWRSRRSNRVSRCSRRTR
jgi:Tfp pilus assembly protein PilF